MIPTRIGWDDVMERELYLLAIPEITAFPPAFTFASPHFAALLVADSTRVADEALAGVAQTLLRAGCSYFCAWGPDCSRAHDIFDLQCLDADPVIMTTWHDNEPLDEALWFFVRLSYPDDAYFDTTRTGLAIVVGDAEWTAHVERRLRDIPSLVADVVQEV